MVTEGPPPHDRSLPAEDPRAEEIALEAATRDPAEREAFVAGACGDDAELQARVHGHLERFEAHDQWLEEIVTRGAGMPGPETPDAFGPYRVREVLGQGGMGTVYLAEREDRDFRMPVALKVLHPALSTPVFRRRFLSERRILARLSHPGIARLIDGGILPDGTHYLAMEYVEGEDLLAWAESRELGLRERVELLLQVCRALAYAHRNLVVHRDLKPSNTRVTPEGEVKLLDFGIARVLDLTEEAEGVTQAHPLAARPMTPAFASPEQRRGEAIGTPSDVYSLGVLLEKLLRSAAHAHGERAGVLSRAIPSDLRAIHEKATRAEPEARYGSAEEMGADLGRWLEGRPVEARAGSTRYRLGRFLSRHRWAASLTALALLGLAGAAGGLALHSVRVEEERDVARLEAERAEAVTAFLVELFDVAGEGTPMDTIRAGTLLRLGEDRLRDHLDPHPLVRASLLEALARAYGRLGVAGARERLLEERVEVLRDHLGPDHREVALALVDAGINRSESRHWHHAQPLLEAGVEGLRAHAVRGGLTPDEQRRKAAALRHLSFLLRQVEMPDSAVVVGRAAMALDAESAVRDEQLLPSMASMAAALRGTGDLEGAEALLREALDLHERVGEGAVPHRSLILNNLASVLRARGVHEEAEPLLREAMEVEVAHSGPDSDRTETVTGNLISLLVDLERFEEAEALARAWEAGLLATHPPDHWRAGRAALRRAAVWEGAGACHEALPLLEAGQRVYTEAIGRDHPWTQAARVRKADCLLSLGRGGEAEPILVEALSLLAAAEAPDRAAIERTEGLLEAVRGGRTRSR